LGGYNKQLGISPFERFRLGGSGLTGFNLTGTEIIALRGYDDGSLSAFGGATTIAKYTAELRYPVSLNPQATIYGLAFAEAGNSWSSLKYFNPYDVKRSAGVGVRIFLPMFGLLGLDYGWRFDEVENYPNMKKSQFHFTIGMNIGDL
jgi:outer membrane protein insertion porin family